VRRLRERYPEVRCKILYQRDYLHLAVKYGLEEPSQLADVEGPTKLRRRPATTRDDLGALFDAG
jgi:hypothetical protein